MQLKQAIAAFLNHRRARCRAPATIDVYRYHLDDLWLAWRVRQGLPDDLAQVTPEELAAYLGYLAHEHINARTGALGLSSETLYSAGRTLRALWNYAVAQQWVTDAQHQQLTAALVRPPASTPNLAARTQVDMAALLAACAQLPDPEERARNRAVLRLLEAGLRPGQVAALTDDGLNLKERRARLALPEQREQTVSWGYDAAVALRAYLWVRSGPPGGALFRSIYGKSEGRALSSGGVRRIAQRMAAHAGVTLPPGGL